MTPTDEDSQASCPLPTGGIDLYFSCEGEDHEETVVTDLTGLLAGGNPLCTQEGCTEFDSELQFLGWAPQDVRVEHRPPHGWVAYGWAGLR